MDTYYICCNWKDRKEDADACTNRMVQCLEGLATCDPAFSEVLIVPRSTREAPYRIPVDFETIKPFMEKGRNREDVPPRRVIEKLGYNISFISGSQKREEQWNIRSMCGAYPHTPGMLNYCKLSLPSRGEALKTLLRLDTMTCSVRAMISAWDPDWAVVQGHDFHDYVRQSAGVPRNTPKWVFLGWIAYFAARVGNVPENLTVHSRVNLEQGTLVVLTEEPITRDRPDHVTTTQGVLTSLQRAGLIPAQ